MENVVEIAYHDRGPSDANTMGAGGSWSVYWYNGVIVSSEIARGLDIFELKPSGFISANEIEAAKSVQLEYLNPQGQPKFTWPMTYALAHSYIDQLERSKGLSASNIAAARAALESSENGNHKALRTLAGELRSNPDTKVRTFVRVSGGLMRM